MLALTQSDRRAARAQVLPYFVEDLVAMGALVNQLTLRWQKNAVQQALGAPPPAAGAGGEQDGAAAGDAAAA